MSKTTFNDLANEVAGELPEGWLLEICLEKNAGWVSLSHEKRGELHEFVNEGDLEASIREALKYAREHEWLDIPAFLRRGTCWKSRIPRAGG